VTGVESHSFDVLVDLSSEEVERDLLQELTAAGAVITSHHQGTVAGVLRFDKRGSVPVFVVLALCFIVPALIYWFTSTRVTEEPFMVSIVDEGGSTRVYGTAVGRASQLVAQLFDDLDEDAGVIDVSPGQFTTVDELYDFMWEYTAFDRRSLGELAELLTALSVEPAEVDGRLTTVILESSWAASDEVDERLINEVVAESRMPAKE
jgi:hypothetical protein